MGMRIQCAQCHNHPFDRWTMDDYYSFAAFFAQIGRKPGADPRETIVFNVGRRRSESPGRRPGDAAEVSRRRGAGLHGPRPPRSAGRMAGVARESVLRQEPGQHRVGPLSSAAASSTRSMMCGSAIRP